MPHLVGGGERVVQVVGKLGGLVVAACVVVDDRAQQPFAQVPLQVLLLRLLPPTNTTHINEGFLAAAKVAASGKLMLAIGP